jgi:hypothetical protein
MCGGNGIPPEEDASCPAARRSQGSSEERIRPAIPRDERADKRRQDPSGPADEQLRNLWYSVVGKVVVDLKGAINLMMFDDRQAIQSEIETIIAGAK